MAEHGKDIQHAPGVNPGSSFTAPKVYSSSSVNKSSSKTEASGSQKSSSGPAPARAARALAPDVDEVDRHARVGEQHVGRVAGRLLHRVDRAGGAQPGGTFELFGGNVSGEFTELQEPTHIVQKWRLAQWPAGHYSTLSIWFDQNDVDAVTVMRVEWKGVPVGQEEPTKTNWDQYYVRSIKTTFGFGTVL